MASLRVFAALSIAAPLCVLGSACTTNTDDEVGEDEAAHTAKDPVQGNDPHFWAPTDYVTFKQIAQAPPFRVGAPLGDEPVTQRLQAWADRIHAEVSRDVKRTTRRDLVAPRPIIVVVPAKDANAWVSGVPACITGKADVSALGSPREPHTVPLAFVEQGKVKEAFAIFGGPPMKCATPDGWNDSRAVVDFFNTLGSNCKLTQGENGDAVAVTGESCTLQTAGARAATEVSQLTIYATSPYVHFTSAMIALANDELAIAGVVAHELGHYYRAHAVSDLVMGKYNHWYQQLAIPERTLPAPLAENAALEARFRAAIPYPMPRVAGQTLGYRISSFAIDGLPRALAEAGLCDGARAQIGEWRWDFGLGASYVKKTTQASYLAYERDLLACADTVRLTASGEAGTLSSVKLEAAISLGASAFATPAVGGATLGEALRTLNERALLAGAEADAFLADVQSRRLGRYTAEQEADDFSVEYIARAGVAPMKRVDSYLELLTAHDAGEPERFAAANGGLDVSTCAALYRDDWKRTNADGVSELVVIPLGNLHDSHHGGCYRLFNMTQEIRAHKLRASRVAPPTFDTPWETIRAEAQRVTDAFRPGGGPGGGSGGPQHTPQGPGGPGGLIVDGL